jgi:hypothetical protein
MRVWIAGFVFVCIGFALAGCETFTDPLGRKEALDLAQKTYTEAIRWGKLDTARAYVDPEDRDAFRDLEPIFDDIRFTDFEIGEFELDESNELVASVTVTYRGYAVAYQLEQSIREHQEWTRIESLANQWQVRSDINEVVAALLGPPK